VLALVEPELDEVGAPVAEIESDAELFAIGAALFTVYARIEPISK
jgi:hypothetical protein